MSDNQKIIENREELKRRAAADYYRLRYHLMPEGGWMNDPNGLIEYKGRYHAFYQHNPDDVKWGPMHWGHAVSDDLLHWTYLPLALCPDRPYEEGCYSGSAVDNEGELTLIYTAHNGRLSPKEAQCIAVSNDGISFKKYENNPVIPAPPDGMSEDFRDPKVSFQNGRWHMVAGSAKNSLGSAVMFASDDLRQWEYKGIICQSNGRQGDMWECPDLFNIDGVDVLMFSPMNMQGAKTLFITGEMDYEKYCFTRRDYYEVDLGHDFYAPQTLQDSKGRRIMIGWMDMWKSEYPTQKSGWAGALTLPRELFIRDGRVCQRPIAESETLRREVLRQGKIELKNGTSGNLCGIKADVMEINLRFPARQSGGLTLSLRASADFNEQTLLSYDFAAQTLTLDKANSGQGNASCACVAAASPSNEIDMRIFVDRSSLEIFACGGLYSITNRIYPCENSVYCDIIAEGADITLDSLDIYRL